MGQSMTMSDLVQKKLRAHGQVIATQLSSYAQRNQLPRQSDVTAEMGGRKCRGFSARAIDSPGCLACVNSRSRMRLCNSDLEDTIIVCALLAGELSRPPRESYDADRNYP